MSDDNLVVYNFPRVHDPVTVEYTFWFKLDGTETIESVSEDILYRLREADIPGVRDGEFYSPFAKAYET